MGNPAGGWHHPFQLCQSNAGRTVCKSCCLKWIAKPADALFVIADENRKALTAMGQLRLRLGHELNLIDSSQYNLLWITEFPLGLPGKKRNIVYVAEHHPFTSVMDEDIALMETDIGAVRAKAYDLVLNGVEMGKRFYPYSSK